MNIGLSYEALAQIGHVLGGCFIVEHAARWTKKRWQIVLFMILLISFKEFFIDLKYEDAITRGSDLVDFLFWNFGVLSGLVLSYY